MPSNERFNPSVDQDNSVGCCCHENSSITQIYASQVGDTGVQVIRKGSEVAVNHKVYDTDTEYDEGANVAVTGVKVVNGHLTQIRTVNLNEPVTEIIDEQLPDSLVKNDTLKNVLVEENVLSDSLDELNIIVDGGRAPTPEQLRRKRR